MKCKGNFVFKSIEKRDGGEFTNEKGQAIKYVPTYRISVDEFVGEKIVNRTFKFPCSNSTLYEKFKSIQPYDDIAMAFEVELYQSSVKLIPIDVVNQSETSEE